MTTVDESALEAKLREKEKLVAVLTSRLEQAAEQLDRMRRTGGGRGGKIASIPPELIEAQKNLCDEMHGAVERWEAAQAVETLQRIEFQVGEIRNLVSGGITVDPSRVVESEPSGNGAATEGQSPWEALKEQMLSAGGDSAADHDTARTDSGVSGESEFSSDQTGAAEPVAASPQIEPILPDFDPVDAPDEIDLESADVETLKAAVLARDEYTTYLLQRLRAEETRRAQPINWDAVAAAPEDLVQLLRDLQTKLEDQLRRSEVELSLERARLGRESMQLQLQQERLDAEARKLGIGDLDDDGEDDVEEDRAGSRWRRMLGLRRDDN